MALSLYPCYSSSTVSPAAPFKSVPLYRFTTIIILKETVEGTDEVVDSDEVAVLVVALHPRDTVLQHLAVTQVARLPEVDHPDVGFWGRIVHKEQRTANHL